MKKVLMLAVLFVGTLAIAQAQQQLEPCLLCNATGQKTMPKQFPCSNCKTTGIMPCLGCNGVGGTFMMGSPMPCILCAGSGRQACLQCMGTGMEMKPAVVGACDACQGKKAVTPMVNMKNRQAIMMMQNMQMQMQQNIKPMQWGQDKKCGRCGMEWYSFPGASKCPQCNAPKYSM